MGVKMTTREDVEFLRKKVQELERENEHLAMENQFLNSKLDGYIEYFITLRQLENKLYGGE